METACSNNRGRVIDCELPYTSGVVRALGIAVDELLQPVYHHGRLLGRRKSDEPTVIGPLGILGGSGLARDPKFAPSARGRRPPVNDGHEGGPKAGQLLRGQS